MNFLFAILVLAGIAWAYGERLINTTRVIASPELPRRRGGGAQLARIPFGAERSVGGGGGELERCRGAALLSPHPLAR
jgi:hypothetical protein